MSLNEHLETQVIDPLLHQTRKWSPTVRYLSRTEVHVYGLSVAASVLLSFYPFLIVMATIFQHFFPHAVNDNSNPFVLAVRDFFPGELGDFIRKNTIALIFPPPGHPVHHATRLNVVSLILLLFTANGVFEPLEVALNRAWKAKSNRSYLMNQLVSFGLILVCGGLVFGSTMLAAINGEFVRNQRWIEGQASWLLPFLFKLVALPLTMLALFLTYWLLPNCKVPLRPILRSSIVVGGTLEILKYVAKVAEPWLTAKLDHEYGAFRHSVGIMIFAMLGSFIVLAGAEWTARHANPAGPSN